MSDTADSPDASTLTPSRSPGSFSELIFVSLPLVISAGSHSVMSIADRMMLAGYPGEQQTGVRTLDLIAAVTPAAMLFWTVSCAAVGTVMYANTFIAQYDGAGKRDRLMASLFQAVWLAVISGIVLLLLLPVSHAVFRWAGHSATVASQEARYFNVLTLGGIPMLVSMALSCFFSGQRQTAVVMWVNLASLGVNVFLDYLLVLGRWGCPALGITGAGIATVAARIFEMVVYATLICVVVRRKPYVLAGTWRPDPALMKLYVRFALPSGVHYFFENAAFLTFLLIVGSLSRDAMAATNLAFSVNSIIFVPLLGFGTAVQTLVGHHIGARLQDAAVRTTWNAAILGVVWTGTAAALLVLFPDVSMTPFLLFENPDASGRESLRSVMPVAVGLLRFVAVYSVFDSLAVVFASSLRGAGDTLFPMVVTTLSGWLIMVLPAWLIARSMHPTIDRLWLTCTSHIVFMGSIMLWRFCSGRWKEIHLA